MLGSPFPLFVHINRTQVVARKVGMLAAVEIPTDEHIKGEGTDNVLTSGRSSKKRHMLTDLNSADMEFSTTGKDYLAASL